MICPSSHHSLTAPIFTKLGWFPSIILMVEKWNEIYQRAADETTNLTQHVAISHTTWQVSYLLVLYVLPAVKQFANRWAYIQHCTNKYLERTNRYTMQRKHSMQRLQTEEETCPLLFSTLQGLQSGRKEIVSKIWTLTVDLHAYIRLILHILHLNT